MTKKSNPGAVAAASGARGRHLGKCRYHKRAEGRSQREGAHELARKLAGGIESLALHLLGEPSIKGHTVWRWGTHGSLAVNVRDERCGRWHSFEEGRGGDALDLIAWRRGGDLHDAMKWARAWLGGAQ